MLLMVLFDGYEDFHSEKKGSNFEGKRISIERFRLASLTSVFKHSPNLCLRLSVRRFRTKFVSLELVKIV